MMQKKLFDFFFHSSHDSKDIIGILDILEKSKVLEPGFLNSLRKSIINLKSQIDLNESQKIQERAVIEKDRLKEGMNEEELQLLHRITEREARIKVLKKKKRRNKDGTYIGLTDSENQTFMALKERLKPKETIRIDVPNAIQLLERLSSVSMVESSIEGESGSDPLEEKEDEEVEGEEGEVEEVEGEEGEVEEDIEGSDRLSEAEKILFLELDLKKNRLPSDEEKELQSLQNEDFLVMKLSSLKRKKDINLLQKVLKYKQKKGTISEEEVEELNLLSLVTAKSAGMNSARIEGYSLPQKIDEEGIKKDEEFLDSLQFTPDDTFFIDLDEMKKNKTIRGSKKSRWFKPIKIECYNINKEKLIDIGRRKIPNHEFINEISIHGASHSIALVAMVLKEKLDYDFFYHANLLMEMDYELKYVKYIMLHILKDYKLPFVIATRQEGLETTFYERGVFPTMYKRWCTDFFKIKPAFYLFKYLWNDFLRKEVPYTQRYLNMMEKQRASLLANPNRTSKEDKKLQILESNLSLKVKNVNGVKKLEWDGNRIVLMQGLGIQAHQSAGRAGMSPFPVLSDMSDDRLVVFNIMPVFRIPESYQNHPDIKKGEDFNKVLIKELNAFQNIAERRLGRHGCLICNFAGWRFFQYLKESYRTLHDRAIQIRDWANKKYFAGKSNYEVYRLGYEISEKAIDDYEKETGKRLTESPF